MLRVHRLLLSAAQVREPRLSQWPVPAHLRLRVACRHRAPQRRPEPRAALPPRRPSHLHHRVPHVLRDGAHLPRALVGLLEAAAQPAWSRMDRGLLRVRSRHPVRDVPRAARLHLPHRADTGRPARARRRGTARDLPLGPRGHEHRAQTIPCQTRQHPRRSQGSHEHPPRERALACGSRPGRGLGARPRLVPLRAHL